MSSCDCPLKMPWRCHCLPHKDICPAHRKCPNHRLMILCRHSTRLSSCATLLKMPFGKPLQNVLSRRVSGYEWWFEKKNQNKKCLISEKDFCWQWELKPASNECLPYGEAYVLMYFKYSLGQPTLPKSLFCSNVKHVDDGFVDWWVSTALFYFIIRK